MSQGMMFAYTIYMVFTRDWCTTHSGFISMQVKLYLFFCLKFNFYKLGMRYVYENALLHRNEHGF